MRIISKQKLLQMIEDLSVEFFEIEHEATRSETKFAEPIININPNNCVRAHAKYKHIEAHEVRIRFNT